MAVVPQQIADRLGRDLTPAEVKQVPLWIGDAVALIEHRAQRLGVSVDPAVQDRVVALAVVAMARKPDNSTMLDVSVDDGRTMRRFETSDGQVSITDQWWNELGLAEAVAASWSGSIPYGRC